MNDLGRWKRRALALVLEAGVDERLAPDDPAIVHLEDLVRHVTALLPDDSLDLIVRGLLLELRSTSLDPISQHLSAIISARSRSANLVNDETEIDLAELFMLELERGPQSS